MKHLLTAICLSFLISVSAYAGGSIGGVGPSVNLELETMDATFRLEALPKAFTEGDTLRRARARLSEAGVMTVPISIAGEEIQVRKFLDSVVDENISIEFLPR